MRNPIKVLHSVAKYGLNFPYSNSWLTWLFDAELNMINKEISQKYWGYND